MEEGATLGGGKTLGQLKEVAHAHMHIVHSLFLLFFINLDVPYMREENMTCYM